MPEKDGKTWIGSIRHMHSHWGLSYRWLVWLSVKSILKPFRARDESGFGWPNTYLESLFAAGADKWADSLDYYECIYGQCTVIWDSVKNRNTGGAGVAGCKCDYAPEPRNLDKGIIRKGAKLP